MAKMIKMRRQGRSGLETKEVTFEEAKSIMEEIYSEGGGYVINYKTKKVIWELDPDVDEILVQDNLAVC
jgi:hypothetical protein